MSKMEFAFVDLQGFISGYNKFVVKEICILTENIRSHEFVKSPLKFKFLSDFDKKQVEWLERNHHGLRWNSGYITLRELQRRISTIVQGKVLLVKGVHKVRWMKDILNSQDIICINVEDVDGDFKLSDYRTESCKKHMNVTCASVHCALRNAVLLKECFSDSVSKQSIEMVVKRCQSII